MKLTHLGGLTAQQFLQDYWQKKPLLIRQAFPGFSGLLSPDELAGLACEESAQSRLVIYQKGLWRLESGPFADSRFSKLPKKNWTLLVQGVNHFLPQATDLLQQFNFIPTARLDDLMVSYAPDGGGVGPHFDSYDVFLLQGLGQRHWSISNQADKELITDAPLRILQNFNPQQEWLLEPGDMLYLPPQYAHLGVAVGGCMTYSIGFRAPSSQELATQFLGYLQEVIQVDGMYEDPDLELQTHSAEISTQMLDKVEAMLRTVHWQKRDVERFLGSYLTEPKPHIFFNKPRNISFEKFCHFLSEKGIGLAPSSQMLFRGDTVFINGEAIKPNENIRELLLEFANLRKMTSRDVMPKALQEILYEWYQAGYVVFLKK